MARPSSWKLALVALGAAALVDACSAAEDAGSTHQAALVSSDLVISQVYGAGGNSGATYKADFVEIFNRGSVSVQLSGYSLQYTSSTGTFSNSSNLFDLPSFSLQPGQYYLVQLASGSNGAALPTPDASTTNIAMNATTGKIVLVQSGSKLNGCGSTATPCAVGSWVDLVGYGAASQYEGNNPTGALSTTTSAFRASGGCVDTGDNGADFSVAAVAPRNSASAFNVCATDAGSDSAVDASDADPDAFSDGATDATGDADDGGIILVDAGLDADDGSVILDAGFDADDGSVIFDAGFDADDGSVVFDAGFDADDGSVIFDASFDADDGSVIVDSGFDADDGSVIVDSGLDADDGSVIVDSGLDADDGSVVLDGSIDASDGGSIDASFDAASDASAADAATDAGADADTDAAADAGADATADASVDAATDAKPDAPTPDATADATTDASDDPGSVGGGGCTCNESGRPSSNAGAIGLTLAVALVLRRRRRG